MRNLKIVYIDDRHDPTLSKYLKQNYCEKEYQGYDVKKTYKEILFEGEKGYKSLLSESDVCSANVILVDNRLFEESTSTNGRFSGKQFKVLLRKLLPFVEVVIITQDQLLPGDNIVYKFSGRDIENIDSYYEEHLDPVLDKAIKEVIDFEELSMDLKRSEDVDKLLIEKILQSLKGEYSYDELTKTDIDELISTFIELKNAYE